MTTLDPTMRAWLRNAMPGMAAATDAAGRPRTARIFAVFADEAADALHLYVPRSTSPAFFAAVEESKRLAANFIELPSYRSWMFKGTCATVPARHGAGEVDTWLTAVGTSFTRVGLPPEGVETMLGYYPSPRDMVALRLDVEAAFDQTPRRKVGGCP